MSKRLIDPVGLRDIAEMYRDNVKYDTLREYSQEKVLPPPAKYVNDVTKEGRTAVWDRNDIVRWATGRGWKLTKPRRTL